MTDTSRGWFEAEPFQTSRELLEQLMARHPDTFTPGQFRTVQRRFEDGRSDAAPRLVSGDGELANGPVTDKGQATSSMMTAA